MPKKHGSGSALLERNKKALFNLSFPQLFCENMNQSSTKQGYGSGTALLLEA
jgi:hypothetical protein